MTTTKPMSAEQFMAIADDGRFDLVDGEVSYLSPSKSWHGIHLGCRRQLSCGARPGQRALPGRRLYFTHEHGEVAARLERLVSVRA
jgi:hypothetical protein